MSSIQLGCGKATFELIYNKNQFDILGKLELQRPLSDIEIGEKLNAPIDSNLLDEIISPNETVLIVVPDATRTIGSGQIVSLLVRRLIASGTMPFEINIIFATGAHRRVTKSEKAEILTPFIAQRIKTLDHDPRDLVRLIRLGETSDGIPVEMNSALAEYDHTIVISGITFHYFAGFTGGRKSFCPGLASSRTIFGTHKLAFDCARKARREGAEVGRLEGNPVHEAFMEVVRMKPPTFVINTIVNDKGEVVDLFCGNWDSSHQKACEVYSKSHTISFKEKRDLVIASCGGYPHDLNMTQANKTLEMASRACKEGGKILILADCADGLGGKNFINWFKAQTSKEMADFLCQKYKVNGQTAWSLLKKAEKFDVRIITSLSKDLTDKMRLAKTHDLGEALNDVDSSSNGYILPFGAKFLIRTLN